MRFDPALEFGLRCFCRLACEVVVVLENCVSDDAMPTCQVSEGTSCCAGVTAFHSEATSFMVSGARCFVPLLFSCTNIWKAEYAFPDRGGLRACAFNSLILSFSFLASRVSFCLSVKSFLPFFLGAAAGFRGLPTFRALTSLVAGSS